MSRGGAVVVRPEIIELSDVRVVVACDWRFVDDLHSMRNLDGAPFQRWVYTIYATGQIYVAVEASVPDDVGVAEQLGLAVSLNAASAPELQVGSTARPSDGASDSAAQFGLARWPSAGASVLFVPYPSNPPVPIVAHRGGRAGSVSLVLRGGRVEGGVAHWTCHVWIGPAENADQIRASERARAYGDPPELDVEVGSQVLVNNGSGESSGFDPAAGSYMLAPDRDQLRFRLRDSERRLFSPVFTVVGSANRQAWVYVNHVLTDHVALTAAGDLIFQIPGTIQQTTLVEVLFRRASPP